MPTVAIPAEEPKIRKFFPLSHLGASHNVPVRHGPMTAVVGASFDRLTCLLGGSVGGEITIAEQLLVRMRDGQSYKLFDLAGMQGKVISIGKPRHEGGEGECSDLWRQDLSLNQGKTKDHLVALFSQFSERAVLPKPLELMDEPLSDHVEFMRKFLAGRDIPNPQPKIVQSVRTDLDGDGQVEYVLNLVRVGKTKARIGDHSILIVLRGEGAARQAFIIQEEIEISASKYPSTLWVNDIVAILDMNGDGTAEIITQGAYLYGGGWEVIRWDGNGFEHVLFCGCDG
jgi:hypothetical protein